jgi:hypothetical protein
MGLLYLGQDMRVRIWVAVSRSGYANEDMGWLNQVRTKVRA